MAARLGGSHPDESGVLFPYTRNNEDQEVPIPGGGGAAAPFPINKMVSTDWRSKIGVSTRGPVDLNSAAENGAVERFAKVRWDDLLPANATGRLRSVDWNMTTRYWPGLRSTVPTAQ